MGTRGQGRVGTSRTKTRVNAADRGVDQPEGVAPVPASHWDRTLCLSHTWAPSAGHSPGQTQMPSAGRRAQAGPARSSQCLLEVCSGPRLRDTRGSLRRRRGSQSGLEVTGPGSQLRSSAPRAGCRGPAAGPRSAEWRSRGRRRTGCAGRPRSPRRSARSQRLRGPGSTSQSGCCPHTPSPCLPTEPRPRPWGLWEGRAPRAGERPQASVQSSRVEISEFLAQHQFSEDPGVGPTGGAGR